VDVTSPASILDYRWQGLFRALAVISLWLVALGCGLFLVEVRWENSWFIVPLILVIMFLFTGLFITAHDAMHRTLMPKDPFWNDLIGRAAVFVFALFSYPMLLRKHHEHHEKPATLDDPDYHNGKQPSYLAWYFHFMTEYMTWMQFVGMSLVFCFLWLVLGAKPQNVFLFWALPAIASTFQLFTFGTYLPHREPRGGYDNVHRAHSNDYPRWLSFLTCYHFGYHFEHHEYPYIPWWKLGRWRNQQLQSTSESRLRSSS
jgi:beta-carotene ketolase (CrtW type)